MQMQRVGFVPGDAARMCYFPSTRATILMLIPLKSEACAQIADETGVCGNSGDTPCAIVKGDEEVVTETTEGCC